MRKLKKQTCVKCKHNHKSVIVENVCHTASLTPLFDV